MPASMASRRPTRVLIRYVRFLLGEFRWTLGILALVVLVGGALYGLAPREAFAEPPPHLPWWAFLVAWMNLFGEPLVQPRVWYLAGVEAVFPLLGFGLIGEGIVRFGMLMVSRRAS